MNVLTQCVVYGELSQYQAIQMPREGTLAPLNLNLNRILSKQTRWELAYSKVVYKLPLFRMMRFSL